MKKDNEIVPIQLREDTPPLERRKVATNKVACQLKLKNRQELLFYNGMNQYILQTILQELV